MALKTSVKLTLSNYIPGILKAGEEGAELAQAVLKTVGRLDEFEEVDGNELFEKIIEEFGDVLASTHYVLNHCNANFYNRVIQRKDEKMAKYEKYYKGKVWDVLVP